MYCLVDDSGITSLYQSLAALSTETALETILSISMIRGHESPMYRIVHLN